MLVKIGDYILRKIVDDNGEKIDIKMYDSFTVVFKKKDML